MFAAIRSIVVAAAVLAFAVQQSAAVCASGQMAVGTEYIQVFTGGPGSYAEFSGFLMANNCGLISQNGITQNSNQLCSGGYSGGASVTCNGSHQPTGAVDTVGQHWTCSPTSDTSCNVGGSGGTFQVVACCNRS